MKKIIAISTIAVLAVSTFVVFKMSGHDAPKSTSNQSTVRHEPEQVKLSLGKQVTDGEAKLTIKEFKCDVPFAGDPGEYDIHQLPKGHLCQARLIVENTSKDSKKFSWEGQTLYGSDGNKYSVDLGFYGPSLVPKPWGDLGPGKLLQAIIIYDVPKNVKPLALELHGNTSSDGVRFDVSDSTK